MDDDTHDPGGLAAAAEAPAPAEPATPTLLGHDAVVEVLDAAWNALVPTAHLSPEQWQHARIFLAEVKHRLRARFGLADAGAADA
jgi:hypothetical protein